MPDTTKKEFITHEQGNEDAWICPCGNNAWEGAFYVYKNNRDEGDPLLDKWDDLFVCCDCGRIIHQDTLEVVGQNPGWKPLD